MGAVKSRNVEVHICLITANLVIIIKYDSHRAEKPFFFSLPSSSLSLSQLFVSLKTSF